MNFLNNILARKPFVLTILISVGLWFLVLPLFTGNLGANPVETLLHRTGEIAIWTLGAVLALSPLRILFPRSRLVTALNQHRRTIGVTVAVYGSLHFACHLLYEGDPGAVARSFSKPFIWLGSAGLLILIVLAATSNNFAVRRLGGRNWKRLHRLAYLAGVLLIAHQSIAGKGHWYVARWLLFPLAGLQLARVIRMTLMKLTRRDRVIPLVATAPTPS